MDIFTAFFLSIISLFSKPIVRKAPPIPIVISIQLTPTSTPSPTSTFHPRLNIKSTPTSTPTPIQTNPVTSNNEESNLTAYFIKPGSSEVFKANDNVDIEIGVKGQITKIEFYIGSGILFSTLNNPPYKASLEVSKYTQGITANYKIPLGVKVFFSQGKVIYISTDLNIVPQNTNKPENAPSPTTNLSHKTLNFAPYNNSPSPDARAEGYFDIEKYDAFNNMTSIKTKGTASGLKPNTEYEIFVITKKGTISIGSLNTDNNGSGTFFTGLGTDQHYCDIYTLGIKLKGVADEQADLWGHELNDICPRG